MGMHWRMLGIHGRGTLAIGGTVQSDCVAALGGISASVVDLFRLVVAYILSCVGVCGGNWRMWGWCSIERDTVKRDVVYVGAVVAGSTGLG
jgi:hypothetical protein